jgi:hypothetical protein
LRTLAQATDGITAKVFSMLNELAVEAVKSGKEQISDEDVESWKPALSALVGPSLFSRSGLLQRDGFQRAGRRTPSLEKAVARLRDCGEA